MLYLKIFEAYSEEDYKKALMKVKQMVKDGEKDKSIIDFINRYQNDDADSLNKLRLMLGRIYAKFLNGYSYILHSPTPTKSKAKKRYGMDTDYEHFNFYAFDKEQKNTLIPFIETEKHRYTEIIGSMRIVDLRLIKYIFDKIFETIQWIIDTCEQKSEIKSRHISYPYDNSKDIIGEINNLNHLDFENEYEEMKRLIKVGKEQIKKSLNRINR